MDADEPASYELPDSKKSYADIMREAGGGRRTGLRTKAIPPVTRPVEVPENPLNLMLAVAESEHQRANSDCLGLYVPVFWIIWPLLDPSSPILDNIPSVIAIALGAILIAIALQLRLNRFRREQVGKIADQCIELILNPTKADFDKLFSAAHGFGRLTLRKRPVSRCDSARLVLRHYTWFSQPHRPYLGSLNGLFGSCIGFYVLLFVYFHISAVVLMLPFFYLPSTDLLLDSSTFIFIGYMMAVNFPYSYSQAKYGFVTNTVAEYARNQLKQDE